MALWRDGARGISSSTSLTDCSSAGTSLGTNNHSLLTASITLKFLYLVVFVCGFPYFLPGNIYGVKSDK